MNKERILEVADAIEQASIPNLGFNMAWWFLEAGTDYDMSKKHQCGTVACIAGWTYAVKHRGDPELLNLMKINKDAICGEAQAYLDVSEKDAGHLFVESCNNDPDDKYAVRVLRHFAETGNVEWNLNEVETAIATD